MHWIQILWWSVLFGWTHHFVLWARAYYCMLVACQVKIQGSNIEMLNAACQQFLGKTENDIRRIAQETLEGHQRAIMGCMTVEVSMGSYLKTKTSVSSRSICLSTVLRAFLSSFWFFIFLRPILSFWIVYDCSMKCGRQLTKYVFLECCSFLTNLSRANVCISSTIGIHDDFHRAAKFIRTGSVMHSRVMHSHSMCWNQRLLMSKQFCIILCGVKHL